MSFKLCSQVFIGKHTFRGGLNEAMVTRSVKSLIDTATIKIPAAGRVNNSNNSLPTSSIETSTLWKEGDPITILLGYNQDYRQEFKGFVRSVDADIPVKIECEGYAFQLRKKQFTGSWKNILLKDWLALLIQGTDIKLSQSIPNVPLVNLTVPPRNALAALQEVVHKIHLTGFFQFDTLYVGLEETVTANTVKYRIGWNVPRTKELEYSLSESRPVLIRLVTGKGKNAKRTIVQAGDPLGSIITLNIAYLHDQESINKIANQLVANSNYTGFKGALNGLLQPYCDPADTAIIIDKMYNVLGASYFVESTQVKFTMSGAMRIVHIGRALSTPQFETLINKNDGQ